MHSPTVLSRARAFSRTGRGGIFVVAALTLMTVFALAVAWEIFAEEQVLTFLGVEFDNEGVETRWEFVITSTVFATIAMVFPVLIALRAIEARDKAAEIEQTARFAAEQANRIKGNFLAHMSHELRTPLNAMLGFGEIIRDETFGKNDPRYAEYAAHIVSSAAHLLALINDVLDLSKLDLVRNNLDEEDVSVDEVADSSLALVKPQAEANGIKLQTEIQDSASILRADPQKLRQILVNLLSNAVKFTPSGGEIILKAWCETSGSFVFQVTDTGIGMAQDDISTALLPFQQIDNPLNRKYPGTGLGLPIVKSLVELHGGTLNFESAVGVGTTVTVCLPQVRPAQEPVNADTYSSVA